MNIKVEKYGDLVKINISSKGRSGNGSDKYLEISEIVSYSVVLNKEELEQMFNGVHEALKQIIEEKNKKQIVSVDNKPLNDIIKDKDAK